ncbi:MAG: hypothetical protein DI558_10185 [Corynebacterium propinquum]|nr:MAG: hypothetical protein DI558_10185 [Corynebacterium propinquum]
MSIVRIISDAGQWLESINYFLRSARPDWLWLPLCSRRSGDTRRSAGGLRWSYALIARQAVLALQAVTTILRLAQRLALAMAMLMVLVNVQHD